MDPVGLLLGGAFKDSVDFTNPNFMGKTCSDLTVRRRICFKKWVTKKESFSTIGISFGGLSNMMAGLGGFLLFLFSRVKLKCLQ